MHFSTPLIALAAVLPASFAAPLVARQEATEVCTLQLNATTETQIRRSIEDTRAGWIPIKENDYPTGVMVSMISTTTSVPNYWNVIPAANETHKLQLRQTPALCASGAGNGSNSTLVNLVDCDSEDSLWKITCQRCQPGFGGECQFHPASRPELCATPPGEQYGEIELVTCDEPTTPLPPAQFFSLGVFDY
ncbi:hypothetical protein JCM6882_002086 [Rhodosporidiobolus microsporus]